MNRNVESHFSELPAANIQRSKFDRSRGVKTSFNAGDLIPFLVEEVLPGDTFDITTSKVVRSQTMLTPVMDNMYLDTYYFFVPNRLVYKSWQRFCGENTEGPWAPSSDLILPCISSPAGGFASGSLGDYMGLPVGVEWKATDDLAPMALPFRAYALICNEFFRDENLSDPLLIPTDDANQYGSNGDNYITDVANGGKPFKVAKYHDYFTSSLPNSQRGDPVGIPISVPTFAGGVFPVAAVSDWTMPEAAYPAIFGVGQGAFSNINNVDTINPTYATALANGSNGNVTNNAGATYDWANFNTFTPLNLAVDIPSQAPGGSVQAEFTVNELRLAFAYQRYLESMARSGGRYVELLLGLFGVRSDDARLQRPEYLGGNRIPINVSEVTNSAQSEADFLGDLGAKSQTNDRHHDFVKSFSEHGLLIGVMCVRYDHSYTQGIERFWTRKKFTDFYNPKFANLGEVPIYQAEIMATSENLADKSKVFGFQEIWADYRYGRNLCTGEMRPLVENSLAHWNLSDAYETPPMLSDEWIRETPVNVDRVLAVSHTVANQFWADIYVGNFCTRPMPLYSVPGLIDHF